MVFPYLRRRGKVAAKTRLFPSKKVWTLAPLEEKAANFSPNLGARHLSHHPIQGRLGKSRIDSTQPNLTWPTDGATDSLTQRFRLYALVRNKS